ncbi:MAG: PspC domain-containing protein [Clostridiales bacterium]|nr:PspC domain-containing protein [Clostridiales bacterium]
MKRLYKVEKGKKICGVCGGVAEFLNIDPTLVRILWAFVALWFGTGIVVYIIAAFVMPNESTRPKTPSGNIYDAEQEEKEEK